MGYGPWHHKESEMTEVTAHMHTEEGTMEMWEQDERGTL